MLCTTYFVANYFSKCQLIWGEDNMFNICKESWEGGGHFPYKGIYGSDAMMG